MKSNIYSILIMMLTGWLMFSSCRKEKIKPDQSETFIKYYGKGGTQTAGNVALTPDGGYIIVGTSDSYGNGKDILVVKTDQYGNQQWEKVIGGAGDDEGKYILTLKNGGYAIAGSKTNTTVSKTDACIIQMEGGGNILFDSLYGDVNYNEQFNKIQQTLDGGLIAVGQTDKINKTKPDGTTTDDKLDMLLLKTTNTGNTEWSVVIGIKISDVGTAVQQYSSDVFATTASSFGASTTDIQITRGRIQVAGQAQYTLISNQNKQSIGQNVLTAVDLIYDSGNAFYVVGSTGNNDQVYLLKLDNNGSLAADGFHSFGTNGKDIATAFSRTSDGGFIITGSTTGTDKGDTDVLLIRTNANGAVSWMKQFGGTGADSGSGVSATSDGGYIVSATIAFGGDATGSNPVLSLIHVDANGELK